MSPLFAAGKWGAVALHLPLLLVAVSLVYSATRHDRWDLILKEALGWGLRMASFLAGLGALLFVLSSYPAWWPAVVFPLVIGMVVYYAWNSPWYRRLREAKAEAPKPPPERATTTQAK